MRLHPSSSSAIWAWLALLTLAVMTPNRLSAMSLVQGSAPRHLVIGQIEDEENEWKAAKVLFFSPARLGGIEEDDAARGRQGSKRGILARLQAGRAYKVAARLDREGKPSLWTRIEKVPAGATTFELTPRYRPPSRPKIEIRGQASWKQVFALEFRLLDALGRSRPLHESLDAEGKLPFLPGSLCWIEMREKVGRRLHLFPIALKKKGAPEILELSVPPPLRIRLRVYERDSGKPIAGARLFDDLRQNEDIRDRGLRTDEDGRLSLWIARPTGKDGKQDLHSSVLFRVLAEGRKLACVGWNTKHLGATGPIPTIPANGVLEFDVAMDDCKPLQGSFVQFSPTVLEQMRLFVRMQTMMPSLKGQRMWTGLPWLEVPVDKDGQYELPWLSTEQGHLAMRLFFPDRLIKQLPQLQAQGKPLGRSERLVTLPPIRLSGGNAHPAIPPIDSRLLQLLDLRVRQANGKRGIDLPIYTLIPDSEIAAKVHSPVFGRFDGTGRLRRLHYGNLPTLFLQGPRGYALLDGSPERSLPNKEAGKASVIQLTTMPLIRGKVELADGRAAMHARVRLKTKRYLAGEKSPYMKAFYELAEQFEIQVSKNGSFEIPYLPFPDRTMLLFAYWRTESGRFHRMQQVLPLDHSEPVLMRFLR
jgi:hypothetical protein